MKYTRMPDGHRGEHLGISHTVKHWLAASEMWNDIAGDVPEALRPRALAIALDATDSRLAARDAAFEHAVLAPHWDGVLRDAWRRGYGAVVERLAEAAPPPDHPSWKADDDGHAVAHIGEGVLMRLAPTRGGGWRMWTAFRPTDFKIGDYRCPPMDARSVQARRAIAVTVARKRLARLQER